MIYWWVWVFHDGHVYLKSWLHSQVFWSIGSVPHADVSVVWFCFHHSDCRRPHHHHEHRHNNLGGGFKHVLFSPLPGEMLHFDEYFSNGLKPPTSNVFSPVNPTNKTSKHITLSSSFHISQLPCTLQPSLHRLPWRNVLTYYKLYGYGLCKGKPNPHKVQASSILGIWDSWWVWICFGLEFSWNFQANLNQHSRLHGQREEGASANVAAWNWNERKQWIVKTDFGICF